MNLRKAPASSMQKTYDECYLTCSTAIYFEGQNNEAEALRAWREALDQIYYHNAYRVPSSYVPRSETERALQDSLRSMELQCKERVDLLQALKKSREEAAEEAKGSGDVPPQQRGRGSPAVEKQAMNMERLGSGTVPQATYADIPRPAPALPARPAQPPRPSYIRKKTSRDDSPRANSLTNTTSRDLVPPAAESSRKGSRTPSPEKRGGMLRTLRKEPKERTGSASSGKLASSLRKQPQGAASKAATQVWPQRPSLGTAEQSNGSAQGGSSQGTIMAWDPYTRSLVERPSARDSPTPQPDRKPSGNSFVRPPSPRDFMATNRGHRSLEDVHQTASSPPPYPEYPVSMNPWAKEAFARSGDSVDASGPPPPPPVHRPQVQSTKSKDSLGSEKPRLAPKSLSQVGTAQPMSYMREFPNHPPAKPRKPPEIAIQKASNLAANDRAAGPLSSRTMQAKTSPTIPRKAVGRAAGVVNATAERQKLDNRQQKLHQRVMADAHENPPSSPESTPRRSNPRPKAKIAAAPAITPPGTDDSLDSDEAADAKDPAQEEWEKRVKQIMKNLPKGVDEAAAKQIFNEIVIQGDEVHWDDVAGLDIAKNALKETVVYPFLRPDLFMGLREPARGMLLFGPPGTGKTMLARAVATESRSVFFAISASSLTSKYLGESEKLVRALFSIAKALAPSIIFVDEIDSLLGARGGSSEHEATRRIKTEFLIQWSDLQKAAAGREEKNQEKGDASRVLVLAATNLPWAIDEAARRRFVRRQYIPLPEDFVREQQLGTLLSAQKHSLRDRELKQLVLLTDGYSGSDITALAKDAAMGPLRSLGEKLLNMSPDDIRPIQMQDFEASLKNIRPSVSSSGLKEFEDWAREFGERGG